MKENENVVDIVFKVSNLIGVKIFPNDMSTAHCLPPRRHAKSFDPPAIIARFISRNIRNEIYSKRVMVKD